MIYVLMIIHKTLPQVETLFYLVKGSGFKLLLFLWLVFILKMLNLICL